MPNKIILIAASILLFSCAEIVTETYVNETIIGGLEHGQEFQIRTRVLQKGDQQYTQTSAVYLSWARECHPEQVMDCADKARQLVQEYQRGGN